MDSLADPDLSPVASSSRLPVADSTQTVASGQSLNGEEKDVDEDEDDTEGEEADYEGDEDGGFVDGMDPNGFASDKGLKPLTPEALAQFKAAQDRAGVIYISRIPPGMRPAKVRHLMSSYGDVGRVYLQQEGELFFGSFPLFASKRYNRSQLDAKRAYLRRKYTATKKAHYTEGWVEFKDKKIARSVAEMLNAQSIGGKKGTRWRDDIWTMKYLPKFKWYMLTEQVGVYISIQLHAHSIESPVISTRGCYSQSQAARGAVSIEDRATTIFEECGACSCSG